jgi:hypothetical protein
MMLLRERTPTADAPTFNAESLIKEARRRQRRRWLIVGLVVLFAIVGFLTASVIAPSPRTTSLLARPLHFPSLQPGESCPATAGATVSNSFFSGVALGSGPVRVLIANRGDLIQGRADLGFATDTPGWLALQTLWFAMPGYDGPFVVRAKRLGENGPIEVQPGQTGLEPGSGPLVVPAGPTLNTMDGFRTMPGSTWVTSAGCYAWQVDGRNFSEVIVVDAAPAVGGH